MGMFGHPVGGPAELHVAQGIDDLGHLALRRGLVFLGILFVREVNKRIGLHGVWCALLMMQLAQ